MKPLVVVAIILGVVALTFTLVGNPFTPLDTSGDLEGNGSEAPIGGFGTGSIHQVRPPDVRMRVTGWDAENIPAIEEHIEIYNGSNREVTFNVYYDGNPSLWPGFNPPPEEAEAWVSFSHSSITIPPKSVRPVTVTLTIPPGTIDYDWEFWVCVLEAGTGDVETGTAIRWLVEMR